MNRALGVCALACLVAGCEPPPAGSIEASSVEALTVDVLATDPVRLHALHRSCRRGDYDATFCARVERANLQRFFSGQASAQEYATLADLPPIPSTFDGPERSTATASAASAEPRP